MADEILAIADDSTQDFIDGRNGQVDHEHIHLSRVRIDARKWLMGKMYPKVYG